MLIIKASNLYLQKLCIQKKALIKVENVYVRESCLIDFKYQNKSLPKEIMNLYKISLDYSSNMGKKSMTSSLLTLNKELKKDNVMSDIITIWNNHGQNVRELRYFSDFKGKVTNILL